MRSMQRGRSGFLGIDASDSLSLQERLERFPWGLIILLTITVLFGLVILYSAVGGQENLHFIYKQLGRFLTGMVLMFVIALMCEEKLFRHQAYLVYAIILLLLILVAVFGSVGMGARRWLDLGVMRIQPSELMKVGVILALARFYHDRAVDPHLGFRQLAGLILLILTPLGLIVKQPDLGTAVLIASVVCVIIFVAGLSWKTLIFAILIFGASLPVVWNSLHDYQRQRVETLFFPERDPLGSGYHIIQSTIAVGSGGMTGKGFLAGSQSHLDFLPERHTDFIFSVLAEEWGFLGGMVILLLYGLIILRGMMIAISAGDRFGFLLAAGVTALFTFQVVINIGMVIGLLPVVGIPLPLISYGGSSMVTILAAMGLLAHVAIYSKYHGRAVRSI
ncbi:MAG: rod shape-determining protein RodA [Magnetococcus sp. DMHC-6]